MKINGWGHEISFGPIFKRFCRYFQGVYVYYFSDIVPSPKIHKTPMQFEDKFHEQIYTGKRPRFKMHNTASSRTVDQYLYIFLKKSSTVTICLYIYIVLISTSTSTSSGSFTLQSQLFQAQHIDISNFLSLHLLPAGTVPSKSRPHSQNPSTSQSLR